MQGDDAEDEEEFSRLMKVRREALGLSLDEVAFLTDLSVRTLHRAEEDAEYRPQRETRARLAWFFGDAAWQPLGYHVIDPEREDAERQAALVEKAVSLLARCLRAPYRRRATGATKALTWLLLRERIGTFLLLSALVPPRVRPQPRAAEPLLSRDEERELGFPEREYGEVTQRTAGGIQRFARAASAYAEALLAGKPRTRTLVCDAWDALADVTDDDSRDFLGLSRAASAARLDAGTTEGRRSVVAGAGDLGRRSRVGSFASRRDRRDARGRTGAALSGRGVALGARP
jgi:transcriptional regulator with XRE-family HTH domain